MMKIWHLKQIIYGSNRAQNHVTDYMRSIFAHVSVLCENCWDF
jgi:hypothetical protein